MNDKEKEINNTENTEEKSVDSKAEEIKEKKFIDIVREVNQKEREEQDKREAEENERRILQADKERNEYAEKLRQEKIELMRLKQGIEEEPEPQEEAEAVRQYTFKEKLSNFIYLNKWWLWIAVFVAVVAAFLIYDTVTTEKPDVSVLMTCYDSELFNRSDKLGEILEQYTPDVNGDGKVIVEIYYAPYSEEIMKTNPEYTVASQTKIAAELQMGTTLLIIADKKSNELLQPEDILCELSEMYPDNENIDKYGFYLKDTKLTEKLEYEGEMRDDIYIGIRQVRKTFTSASKMQKNYDIAVEILDGFIAECTD